MTEMQKPRFERVPGDNGARVLLEALTENVSAFACNFYEPLQVGQESASVT
jgi:hypothetical protein